MIFLSKSDDDDDTSLFRIVSLVLAGRNRAYTLDGHLNSRIIQYIIITL